MKNFIFYPLSATILFFETLGNYFNLMSKIFRSYNSWKYYLPLTNSHMFQIGIKSVPIVIITGLFSGLGTQHSATITCVAAFAGLLL